MARPLPLSISKKRKMVGDWDNAEHELPTMVLKQEPTCLNESIESLLVLDRRSSQVDRGYLLRFFQSLGLDTVDDLKDVALFESLSDYLRTSLEAYQKSHGYEGLKSGAMRAMLGCLLKRLEVGAPSKGIGTGQKMRYRRPCRKLPGLHGWPQCRGRSCSKKISGTSSAGSLWRPRLQDHWRPCAEPALRMAALAGDTNQCQQLLAARAEVNVRWKSWTPLMGAAERGHGGVVLLLLEHMANVNAVNKKRRSALSFAVAPSHQGAKRTGSPNIVIDHLITHRADVDMKDTTRRTALDRARDEGFSQVADLLKKWNK